MSRLTDELPINEEPYVPFDEPPRHGDHEATNFLWLAIYQVLLRIGWIFKTESVVMPVFLSLIGGGPVLLGCLPLFNRLGFSVPPLLYAQRLRNTARKKWAVCATTFGMALPFGVLSIVWFSGVGRQGSEPAFWMPYAFLAIYAVFFCVTGLNQLGMHTLQGKLIRADLRGRLFMASVLVGAPLAVLAAWLLMPGWMKQPEGFGWVFGFIALAFIVAAGSVAATKEVPDNFTEESTNAWQKFQSAWRVVADDSTARSVAILAGLVSANFMLFPHYQALYPRASDVSPLDGLNVMMSWVCIQNVSTALASLVAGPMADRFGNRAALRFTVFGLALGPLIAIGLSQAPEALARPWFWLVFAPIGFMPVSIKLLINYTLEIAPEDDHPRYVSAIGMCLAVPVIVGSPLVGWLVKVAGLFLVFLAGLAVLLVAGVQTLRLSEPRHVDLK